MTAVSQSPRMLRVAEQRPARQALESLVRECLVDAVEGAASLVVLHGPPGGGKTRVVTQFAEDLGREADFLVPAPPGTPGGAGWGEGGQNPTLNLEVPAGSAPSPPTPLPRSTGGEGRECFASCLGEQFTVQICQANESFRSERSTREGGEAFDPNSDPDLLVIEDLQHLPPKSVETLLQTLDDRQSRQRATVITASAGPRHLRFRGEPYPARLTSRLAAGLVVEVPLPSQASARAALEAFLRDANVNVPSEMVDHLAKIHRSLRSLEGAVRQLELLARLQAGPLKTAPLREHFEKQTPPEKSAVERIVQTVAKRFHVTAKDVRSKSRQRGVVVPRHVSMYLTRQLTPLSFQQIASYFGDCDHATVLHACRKMEKTLASDPELGGTVRQLQNDLA